VVIVSYCRTALCKAKRGSFKDTACENMLAHVLKTVVAKAGVDAKAVDDIAVGNVLQPGAGAVTSRMGGFLAGIPHTTSLYTLNRQCSSGLQAIAHIAHAIKAGSIDIGIGAGVENMTQFSFNDAVRPDLLAEEVFEHEEARNCLMGMGVTSDNVAAEYGISREEQDEFAARSQQKAEAAQANGDLQSEITPMETIIRDKDGNEKKIVVEKDEGVRPGTTAAKLAKLKPAFDPKNGTTTAGNASQVTDGAAAVLLARRSVAEKLGLPIEGRFHAFATAGVPPHIMGVGPAYAIPEALRRSGFSVDDVDVYEINEAFASQALFSQKKLGIPDEKVNPRGGAIALGHPLGATGARQLVTLFSQLKKTGGRIGCTSMCIGTGMGAAAVFERE
jgi:acetyl-CoA acyltransferase 1